VSTSSHRIFLALWPDPSARAQLVNNLARHRRAAGGRAVPCENLHVTLAFIGAVSRPVLDRLEQWGATHAWPAVTLRLDTLEWWREAEAAVLCASAPPAELLAMQDGLAGSLEALGAPCDRRPYRPHLTIARAVREAPAALALAPIELGAMQVALVESETVTGAPSRYRPRALWPTMPGTEFRVNRGDFAAVGTDGGMR
jgi:2'-5' RNA ligase